ncbi:MAG: hypothetical protein EA362_06205 [Saprospirales bacterium]|nr:MAG: hypothetical protein EA362_06205 [Saprospirales bacterium]
MFAFGQNDEIVNGDDQLIGLVLNKRGYPLIGFTVYIEGLRRNTTTNLNGEYNLRGIGGLNLY